MIPREVGRISADFSVDTSTDDQASHMIFWCKTQRPEGGRKVGCAGRSSVRSAVAFPSGLAHPSVPSVLPEFRFLSAQPSSEMQLSLNWNTEERSDTTNPGARGGLSRELDFSPYC